MSAPRPPSIPPPLPARWWPLPQARSTGRPSRSCNPRSWSAGSVARSSAAAPSVRSLDTATSRRVVQRGRGGITSNYDGPGLLFFREFFFFTTWNTQQNKHATVSSSASPTLQVWLGLLTNGKFVAVKEIEFGAGAEDTAIAAEIKTELDLMRKCAHTCIPVGQCGGSCVCVCVSLGALLCGAKASLYFSLLTFLVFFPATT